MPEASESVATIKVLALLNRLSLNAYKAKTQEKLIFLMLNDTLQVIPYQRAVLWDISNEEPQFLGVSGQSALMSDAPIVQKWELLLKELKNKAEVQKLSKESFHAQQSLFEEIELSKTKPTIQWLPIIIDSKPVLALWLERWNSQPWKSEELEVLTFLMQAYGAAWGHFFKKQPLKLIGKSNILITAVIIVAALFFIHVPLRIVAPMEVVPKDPVVVAAPIEGVIKQVDVKPGEAVKRGDLLVEYDVLQAEHDLQATKKERDIIASQLQRATIDSFKEKPPSEGSDQNVNKDLADVSVLKLQLQRQTIKVNLLESELKKMHVKATIDGVVMMEDPDSWRGHPVRVGEVILTLASPEESKIRIWIPESDNINLDLEKPIDLFLHADPNHELKGKLVHVSENSTVSPQGVPSFEADGEWVASSATIKLGLKGTAVLYGENVTLFYWIARRPWAFLRELFGL